MIEVRRGNAHEDDVDEIKLFVITKCAEFHEPPIARSVRCVGPGRRFGEAAERKWLARIR